MKAKSVRIFLINAMLFGLLACSGEQGEAKELFETAQFEELQKNTDHARKLYEDLLKRYPKTKYAKKAEIRLAAMEK
jgi:outer membrane protein assembly factor BamD (BamD/ComL family)